MVQRFIEKSAKSEKPFLHREPASFKNPRFETGDFKIWKLLANLSLDEN
jgi:hypothetical protein